MADTSGHPPATTIDTPSPPEMLADRLSDLPEPLLLKILSLLPAHRAAQTSCLSRHFRLLWLASPSLYLYSTHFFTLTRFLVMVDRVLLRRDRSAPLESLCIRSTFIPQSIPITSFICWINHAAYLGMKHLHLALGSVTSVEFYSAIFSIKSLESLRITPFNWEIYKVILPTHTVCTCLKSLTLWLKVDEPGLTRLVRELPVLEYLDLSLVCQAELEISSLSVTTLKLQCGHSHSMKLCFPKLDVIYLCCPWVNNVEMFQGEMPLVSKAEFRLTHYLKEGPCVLWSMLKSVSNAIELKLYLFFSMPRQYEGAYLGYSEMQLHFPRLEYLYVSCSMYHLRLFQEEMPALRKADIHVFYFTELMPEISCFLKSIANVVDLKLIIKDVLEYKRLGETYLRCLEIHLPFPKLEYLEFSCSMCFIKMFQVEMPVLRKANIHLYYAKEEFVPQANSFLKCIANVVDLKLTIQDAWDQLKPFHFLESYNNLPLFPRLTDFELSTSCHEATIEDVIYLLQNSPVLNCLKIHHMDPHIENKDKKEIYWQSKLPRNSQNNFRHACFSDLHIRDVKSIVIKLLSEMLTSKKRNI